MKNIIYYEIHGKHNYYCPLQSRSLKIFSEGINVDSLIFLTYKQIHKLIKRSLISMIIADDKDYSLIFDKIKYTLFSERKDYKMWIVIDNPNTLVFDINVKQWFRALQLANNVL